jgi:hypothetical protein
MFVIIDSTDITHVVLKPHGSDGFPANDMLTMSPSSLKTDALESPDAENGGI